MGTGTCGQGGMANQTVIQGTRMPLKIQEFEPVIHLAGGGNGMGTVVAPLTVDLTMVLGHTVQWLIQSVTTAMAGNVITARLVQPGFWILRYMVHCAVTIHTVNLIC